jgi:hypothetical protein
MNGVWLCLLGRGERLSRGVALVNGGCDWAGNVGPWLRLLLGRDETSSMCDFDFFNFCIRYFAVMMQRCSKAHHLVSM